MDLYPGSDELEAPLPLTITSRVLYMLGDIASGPTYRITQWLELVRKRSAKYHSSGFPRRPLRLDHLVYVHGSPLLESSSVFEVKETAEKTAASLVDAYELKVRLEHILERISLISEAANTERPSQITSSLFIGGALAAQSVYTLQRLGITHILCLCSSEIGQSYSQFPDLFEYKNFSEQFYKRWGHFIDILKDVGGMLGLTFYYTGNSIVAVGRSLRVAKLTSIFVEACIVDNLKPVNLLERIKARHDKYIVERQVKALST